MDLLNLQAFYEDEYRSNISYIVYNINASPLTNKTTSLTNIANNKTFLADTIETKCKVYKAIFIE